MMNLKTTDLIKTNDKNVKKILKFNIVSLILIYIALVLITILFLSVPLGIVFGGISIMHLFTLYLYKYKLISKQKQNEQLLDKT